MKKNNYTKTLKNKICCICYIGLGSNLDNPSQQLTDAIENIKNIVNCKILKISKFYHTKPVGYLNQSDFVNAVTKISTNLSPHSLLNQLKKIEKLHNRVRNIKNGPRTLDLDLLLFGNRTIITKELIIPHPRMWNREFVLLPLADVCSIDNIKRQLK